MISIIVFDKKGVKTQIGPQDVSEKEDGLNGTETEVESLTLQHKYTQRRARR